MTKSNVVEQNRKLIKDIIAIQKRLNESIRRLDKADMLNESLFIAQMVQYADKIKTRGLTNIFQFSKEKKNLIFKTPNQILADLRIEDENVKNMKLKELRERYKKFESYGTRTVEGVRRHRVKQLIGLHLSQLRYTEAEEELSALLNSDKNSAQLKKELDTILNKYKLDPKVNKATKLFETISLERIGEIFKLLKDNSALEIFGSESVLENIDKIASKTDAEIMQKITQVSKIAAKQPVSYTKAVKFLAGDYEDFFNM